MAPLVLLPMSNGGPRRTSSHPFAMQAVRASDAESSNANTFASTYLLRTSPPLVVIAAIAGVDFDARGSLWEPGQLIANLPLESSDSPALHVVPGGRARRAVRESGYLVMRPTQQMGLVQKMCDV